MNSVEKTERLQSIPVGGLSWKSLILMALMMFSAIGAILLKPDEKLANHRQQIDLSSAIPTEFGDWKASSNVTPVALTAEQNDRLNATYEQLISRTYVNSQGVRVMVSVAYGSAQKEGLRAHRQEVCYAAQGFQIRDLKEADVSIGRNSVSVTQMIASQGQRVEPVTYWFTMGNEVVRGAINKLVVQLKYSFSGYIPDGYLVRVSTIDGSPEDGFRLQREFLENFMSAIPTELQVRLLGGV